MTQTTAAAKLTFRNMDPSPAIETKVQEAFAKLRSIHERIVGCSVVVERQHRHHHKGNLFHVRIDIVVPGGEIAVSRDPELDHAHEDVYVAIRDSFDAARRRVQDHLQRLNAA